MNQAVLTKPALVQPGSAPLGGSVPATCTKVRATAAGISLLLVHRPSAPSLHPPATNLALQPLQLRGQGRASRPAALGDHGGPAQQIGQALAGGLAVALLAAVLLSEDHHHPFQGETRAGEAGKPWLHRFGHRQ